MNRAHNVVLYAVLGDARRPLASFAPDTRMLGALVTAKIGNELREVERSGAPVPEFRLVSEAREADEGGRFVVKAEFYELDFSGRRDAGPFNTLAELFAPRAVSAPVVESPQSAEDRARAELSARLAV